MQGYTNCEEAELFLNDQSLGRLMLNQQEDRVLKWLVPFEAGKLTIVGYLKGQKANEYTLQTAGCVSRIQLKADRTAFNANHTDVVHVEVTLLDAAGVHVPNDDIQVAFSVEGGGLIIGVDNGWEYNVQNPQGDRITTHNGKAQLLVQSYCQNETIRIKAKAGDIAYNEIVVKVGSCNPKYW